MVSFSLEPPNTGNLPRPPASTQGAAETAMAATALAMTMEGVFYLFLGCRTHPTLERIFQLWVSQTSTMTREEEKEELRSYLEAWSGCGKPDYTAIQNQVVASGD
jgi:hypothetical protein